jgi:PAS domain S-box-containing protein
MHSNDELEARRPSPDETAVLRAIVEGTAEATGVEFFRTLVRNLAAAIDVPYAFVAEFAQARSRVRTRAYWAKGQLVDNVEYDLAGTPCQDVVQGALCHYPSRVSESFPDDPALAELGIESYLGVPLIDSDGNVLGHLAVCDERPMPEEPRRLFIFKIFASRASAELQRLRADQALRDSEQRFRDLFEEAPIAYVFEDTETRFVHANRAAMELLGLKPEDVPGTIGYTLVAPDQAIQHRVHEAFADIQRGRERGLPELELRRKDDGRPVWVQFWSRPEPDGKHTRTMIIDITERVLAEREKARLQQQNKYLQEEIKARHNFEEIIGLAPPLRTVLRLVDQVAATDSTVLIVGETGTGKELIASAIHNRSRQKSGPFIKLNCAALPTGLVESELFGHEKGAFTGAVEKRIGRFALADGGTIFLDEIGDMPLDVQVKLLRVLQEQEFEPIGATKTVNVQVRVVAATNRDLWKAVEAGDFRADLYYRLNVFPIVVPPLRERKSDLPLLAHYFLNKYAAKIGRAIECVSPAALDRLSAYHWPGNIRELENIIERAVILADGPCLEIGPDVLQVAPVANSTTPGTPDFSDTGVTLSESERQQILFALERTKWVIDGPRGAAKILGLHPNTLRSRMKKLGIARR